MKFILITFTWLMIPIAFAVVVFDIAKAAVESKVVAILEKSNG